MKHHRIVLDTNVLISAILFGGPPRDVLKLVIGGTVGCSISLVILDELRDVLQRPKFKFSSEQAFNVLEELHASCSIINPMVKINVITEDPDDNKILECAIEANAAFIVSGDRHLLDLVEFRGVKILTPAAFIKVVKDAE